ncbi:hypothetical protein Xszus_02117 [Xenorhabdus szentirmaii]|nr:hypothetical protein Xszus_02117 [Xenorhabdus szentirmaii]
MRNNMLDGCAIVPQKPQAIRNRRAWKRRLALFITLSIAFIPV